MKITFMSSPSLHKDAEEAVRKAIEETGASEALVTDVPGKPPEGGRYIEAFLIGVPGVRSALYAVIGEGEAQCRFAGLTSAR